MTLSAKDRFSVSNHVDEQTVGIISCGEECVLIGRGAGIAIIMEPKNIETEVTIGVRI